MESILKIDQLTVAYGQRVALNGVSLELPAGSILALIGPNGAGKSTLIRTISGVQPKQEGSIWVAGHELSSLSVQERARQLAVVPQRSSLPPAFTAWETVLLGRTPHLNWLGQLSPQDENFTRQAMERTNSLDLADRLVGELSGGEQQRLLLARALAQAAPLLLLDEPTAHLDLQYQISLLDLVSEIAHSDGHAVLIALHDLNLAARYADQVALLVGGNLCAVGTPNQVLQADLLSEAYRLPLHILQSGPGGHTLVVPGEIEGRRMQVEG